MRRTVCVLPRKERNMQLCGTDHFGVCKLCGSLTELRHSHIMPDFYIRSQEARIKTGSQGEAQPHSFVRITQPDIKDGWMQRNYWEKQLGWKEYLLCDDCEQRFGDHESKVKD